MAIQYIQPVADDGGAQYWVDVDTNPQALVMVEVLTRDTDGTECWWPVVFSTRARAEAFLHRFEEPQAVVSVRIIDDPDYGERKLDDGPGDYGCPSGDCPYCNGEACNTCDLAGRAGLAFFCGHDVTERHEGLPEWWGAKGEDDGG